MESQVDDIQRTRRAIGISQLNSEALSSELTKTDRFFSASGRIDVKRVKAEIQDESFPSQIIDPEDIEKSRSGQFEIKKVVERPQGPSIPSGESLSSRDVGIEEFMQCSEDGF